MNKSEYWAKCDGTTLEEHINDVITQLMIIKELGYITSEKLYKLVELSIEYHDLGKVNKEFQHRVREKIKHLKFDPAKEVVHNVLSLYFIDAKKVQAINPKDNKNYYRVCFAVLFHHNYGDTLELFRKNEDRSLEVLKEFENEIFPVNQKMCSRISKLIEIKDEIAIKLKGFLHKCDYAASGHYQAEYKNDFLEEGLAYCLTQFKKPTGKNKQNAQSVSETELSKYDKSASEETDVDWNVLQYFCKEKQNQNIIAVAQTGMGKTEAGLLWIGNHKGFFVLPIRTAINAIYARICKNMLPNSTKLDEQVGILHSEQLEYYAANIDDSDENIYEYVKRGKQLSLPLNISTVDQLFDFVFQYPGYELKLTTLSYSKIVIDEIQMYNAELLAYLIFGLEKIVQMGGKVAILTATLPPFVKELLEQYLNIPKENQKVFIDDKQVRHHIKVCDKKINAEDIVELYLRNKEQRKSNPNRSNKILVVCNKIKTAQKLFDDVKELIKRKYPNEEIHLFHSRFIKEQKEKMEKDIMKFGQTDNETGGIDKRDGIWIATSVVEASLDIDFDYLVTELQDLCSLLQRMGRCNRKGLKDVSEVNCYIYTQIDAEDLIKKVGKELGKKIYGFIDPVIYELSKQAISEQDGILTESQKQKMLQQYFTTENMQGSHFMRSFRKTYKDVSEIKPYTYKKDEKKLREILTETIIPGPIYERESIQEEILGCVQKLKQPGLSVVQRQKLRSQIMKYTVSVPYYHWKNYQKVLKSKKDSCRKVKAYPAVQIGKYEKIEVMDCNYDDERGYSPIEWTNEREE